METVNSPVTMVSSTFLQLVFILCRVKRGVFAEVLYESALQTSTDFPSRIYKDGDLIIGVIIPVTSSEDCCNGTMPCNDLVPESIMWTEALMFAIQSINQDNRLLGNVTLGFDIRDSCDSGPVAMSHALDFLDVIEESQFNELVNCSAPCHEQPEDALPSTSYNVLNSTTEYNKSTNQNLLQRVVSGIDAMSAKGHQQRLKESPFEMSFNSSAAYRYSHDICNEKPVSAIIGCYNSDATSSVAATLQAATVPIVGLESTAVSLGDKIRYPTFMRTVLGDNIQAKALVKVLNKFGWSYISIIGTQNEYGRQGVEGLLGEVENRKICVAVSEYFTPDSHTIDADIKRIVATLLDNPKATVVVLYMGWRYAQLILKEADRQNVSGVIWMSTEAWGEHPNILDFRRSLVEGAIGLALPRSKNVEFREHLRSLDVVCSENHPWLYKLVCSKRHCDPEVIQYHRECCLGYFRRNRRMACPLPSALKIANILRDTVHFINYDMIFNAVYTIAYGLDALLKNSSFFDQDINLQNWSKLKKTALDPRANMTFNVTSEFLKPQGFQYSKLVNYMKHIDARSLNDNNLRYSENGNIAVGQYNVVNLQFNECKDRMEWKVVGRVQSVDETITIHINKGKVRFPGGKTTATSRCSAPCAPGSKMLQSPQECCWECQPCPGGTISNMSMALECSACGIIQHTDPNNTICLPDKLQWLFYEDAVGVVILVASVLGQIITLMVISILGRHKNNPICSALTFKTTSLLVCFVGFLQPIIYTVQPTDILCIFQKLTWCSVYIVHGATLVSRTHKVKFLVDKLKRKVGHRVHNVHHVVMWTFAIVGFVLLGVSFLGNVPYVKYKKESLTVVFVICVENMAVEDIVVMGYPLLLLVVTGLLTETSKHGRSLDDKFLSYTSGAMLLMLVVFLPIYYTIEDGIGRVIILAVSVIITQYAILFLTYFTKIYYMFRSYHKKESMRTALARQRQNIAALVEDVSEATNGSVKIDKITES